MRITQKQIEAAYKIAMRVFANKIKARAGAQLLRDKHGMNLNSAHDFIGVYRRMREGTFRNRWLGASATEYYFRQIESTNGRSALATAIESTRLYIDNNPRTALNKLRDVVARFSPSDSPPIDLADFEAEFAESVERSARDSSAARRRRLQRAPRLPRRLRAVIYVFERNADVVAEVLRRAAGVCEGCRKPAPFLRKKDGTPYLEVHHTVQLVHGGEDTVNNAMALCPNCHRKLHYGRA